MTIRKYPLQVVEDQDISLPVGAKPLVVQVQNGEPCMWVIVDQWEDRKKKVRVSTVSTGVELFYYDGLRHIGTYQLVDGAFVGHVFVED